MLDSFDNIQAGRNHFRRTEPAAQLGHVVTRRGKLPLGNGMDQEIYLEESAQNALNSVASESSSSSTAEASSSLSFLIFCVFLL